MRKMTTKIMLIRQVFVAFVATLVMVGLPFAGVHAQAVIDVEPPTIEHEVVDSGFAGELQSFVAEVLDNNSLQSVALYYRLNGVREYTRLDMIKQQKDRYQAEVATEPDVETVIQYYIEAIDVGGTTVTRGFSFNPLTRDIVLPAPVEELASAEEVPVSDNTEGTVAEAAKSDGGFVKPKKRNTWLYVAGGVLALGLIASLAGGSGDDDDPVVATPCGDAGCNITFTVTPP